MSEKYIGIDIGGTQLRAGWISGEEIVHLETRRVHELETEKEVLDSICELISSHPDEKVKSIGIGVPSVVDTSRGIVYDVQNLPGWKEVHLKSIVEDRFRLPVHINNDANCLALGEYYFGKGKPFESMIGLNIGTGFAGGIIINGKLYEGNNCGAGEFGMIPFKSTILEHYCGGLFFNRKHKTSGEKLSEKAKKGDLRAMSIFEEFGRYLGFAMKTILYSYDPEAIILGGSVSRSFRYFENSMRTELEDFAFSKSLEKLTIDVSEKKHIAVLGAAALCKQQHV